MTLNGCKYDFFPAGCNPKARKRSSIKFAASVSPDDPSPRPSIAGVVSALMSSRYRFGSAESAAATALAARRPRARNAQRLRQPEKVEFKRGFLAFSRLNL